MKTLLREKLVQAMRDKDSAKKDILRLALGQIEATESKMPPSSNAEKLAANSVSVIKKIVNENSETIGLQQNEEVKKKLMWENEYLTQFLPITMEKSVVESLLKPLTEELKAMKEGQAMGLAMKTLKPHGALDSAVVKQVLDEIRG